MKIHLSQPYSFIRQGKRSNQEDARFPDADMPQGPGVAFVVCDGVGGHDKGEVASTTVCRAAADFMKGFDPSWSFGAPEFAALMERVYARLDQAAGAPTDMGTTMTFVCFNAAGAFCAHIGDSRIYHVRPGSGILYRSEDHSLVNALVHSGNLTPEEAIGHPQSNIITRCISPGKSTTASAIQIRDIDAGDYFFMCTDGVLHQIDDARLCGILSSGCGDAEKMSRIEALSSGSDDNNTAYLIGVRDVVHDMDEMAGASPLPEDGAGAAATAPLDAPREMVTEIPVAPAPAGKGFIHFVKNMFKQ